MADTLEESLRSILDQLEGDKRFEVLVVDDGSTDGSQEILDKLEEEYEILRWIEGDNENIGEARAQANREAKGDYVIVQFDADDKFKPVIKDLVKIYEKVNENREGEFFMSNIGPKSLLTRINYRSLGRGEDRDLWHRLSAEDAKVNLESEPYAKSIGYDYSRIESLRNGYNVVKNLMKSGITCRSYIKWKIGHIKYKDDLFRVIISPIAKLQALYEGIYDLPDECKKYNKNMEHKSYTLTELEEKYEFDIKSELSEKGRDVFRHTES
jgi:glycosyltransferase involved in cell wall biosynthesis